MPIAFDFQTPVILTGGFVDDADPNVGPTADRTFEVPKKRQDGQPARGLAFFVKFTNPSGPSRIDVQVWLKDARSGVWSQVAFFGGIDDPPQLNEADLAGGAEVYFQLTNLNAGTATDMQLFAEPL